MFHVKKCYTNFEKSQKNFFSLTQKNEFYSLNYKFYMNEFFRINRKKIKDANSKKEKIKKM